MRKDTFYFPHDYGARNDLKMIDLRMKMKSSGIGIYWQLVEMLYEAGGIMPLQCDRIAFAMQEQCNDIMRVISEFDLFTIDGENFFSKAVLDRLAIRNDKSEKAKDAAFIRWEKEKKRPEKMRP